MRPLKLLGPVVLTVACSSPAATSAATPKPPVAAPSAAPAKQASAPKAATAWLKGIDVSHYQPKVDWERVKTSASFVFVKATDSTGGVDARFTSHWSGAKKVGLPRGAYHFFHPKYDVDQQVANFTQHLKSDPGELHPVVDVEEFKTEYQAFTCEQLAQMLQRFSQGVEKELGRKPMIYTN
ncbi:GH25 family lysozyme, partial [Archangium sp.]|uniref:glycoside hydrolase family 25 protein n=1 Tax=Archangium sp. TaxID=1872627 RepID=UPI00286C4C09